MDASCIDAHNPGARPAARDCERHARPCWRAHGRRAIVAPMLPMTAPAERRTDLVARVALLLAGLAAVAYLAGLALERPGLCFVTKPLPVLGLLVAVCRRGRGAYASLLAVGLALSALGDVLLELPHGFLPGLGAFLAAHLAYVAAFVGQTRRLRAWRALPFVLYAGLFVSLLWPGLGALRAPVLAYVAAIASMQWRAAACIGATPRGRRSEWAALLGALTFALSDSLLGLDRFHSPLGEARVAVILFYWLGQYGLAVSTWIRPTHGAAGSRVDPAPV